MLRPPAPSRPRKAILGCLLVAGGTCVPLSAAAVTGLGGLIDAALTPYLLGGVGGLAAGLVFRRLLRRRPPPDTQRDTPGRRASLEGFH